MISRTTAKTIPRIIPTMTMPPIMIRVSFMIFNLSMVVVVFAGTAVVTVSTDTVNKDEERYRAERSKRRNHKIAYAHDFS